MSRLVERVSFQVTADLDVGLLAEQFAALTDDAQAQFLCMAARQLGAAAGTQAHYIGRHLRTCDCSTEEGRDFVRAIVASMAGGPTGGGESTP